MGLIFDKEIKYKAQQVDEDIHSIINEYEPSGTLVKVKPYPDNPGLSASIELLETLHKVKTEGRIRPENVSPVNTFEIWYDQNKIQFLFYIKGDSTDREKFFKQLSAHFDNADVKEIEEPSAHFPKINDNEWVSGARFHLAHHYFEPIRHQGGVEDIGEPYKQLTNDMVTKSETRMIFQVAFKPAKFGWTETYFEDVSTYAERVEGSKYVSEWFGLRGDYVPPPDPTRRAASNMKNQEGKPGYHINVRMLAIGPTKEQTEQQCKSVGDIVRTRYFEPPGQTFVPEPANNEKLKELFKDFVNRRGDTMELPRDNIVRAIKEQTNKVTGNPYKTMVMTAPEVASVAHIPDNSIKNNAIDWSLTDTSGSPPADAPTFEDILQQAQEGGLPSKYGKPSNNPSMSENLGFTEVDKTEETEKTEEQETFPDEIPPRLDELMENGETEAVRKTTRKESTSKGEAVKRSLYNPLETALEY